ncbi:MAG: amidase [Dehalococcoidia bacterium]|nr:MAG: amidase [Dehalococcoidia bacterium]
MTDAWRLDATAQAELVRQGEASPAELVEAAIARIERLNARINAVVTPMFDEARHRAAEASTSGGPFGGVPMLLKDASIEVEGAPYYIGTRVLRAIGWRSRRTTELARRLAAAGFVFLGKTNVPVLSTGITTEPPAFGPTRNPWDLERSAGGSSGGSAAAVASGMVSIAHGADGTGSLRYPAACCGVATLKPSRGLVPCETPTGEPDALGVWAEFVLARSVRDLAGVLDAVADAPAGARYAEAIASPPPRLRVGLLTRDVMTGMSVDAECVAAVERTGELLRALGHEVEESHPAALEGLFVRTAQAIGVLVGVGRRAQVGWLAGIAGRELTADDVDARSLATAAAAERITDGQAAEAVEAIKGAMAPIRDWWRDGHDLLVTPVLRQPPWPLGQTGGPTDGGSFPGPFSFSGQPAMSLPLHWTASGLPAGVQVVGAYGRDDLLLCVASQLEQAAPWAHRWPDV